MGRYEAHEALHKAYKDFSEIDILLESLAYRSAPDDRIPEIAKAIVPHTRLICIDTESFTSNTDAMTEFGLAQISYQHAKAVKEPGPHGHEILKQLQFLHFRIVEHAHLKSYQEGSVG
jgi:hypothetical protein